jgi:hypothetical protein
MYSVSCSAAGLAAVVSDLLFPPQIVSDPDMDGRAAPPLQGGERRGVVVLIGV